MALTSGARLGPYEILAPLGQGGMGEVYKGRDTRLDRIVAIKVLPDVLARDPQFRDRFEREARTVSQLDHPHICPLYDVGEVPNPESQIPHPGTIHFLVMQYLEGETLAQRLAHVGRALLGPPKVPDPIGSGLPLEDALTIAIQIADALDKAHRAGIVHRDLKPGNIFLTRSGGSSGPPAAKLLDFGLAKTVGPAIAGSGLSMLPTSPPVGPAAAPLTAQGTILGTFQYMAPEQIEGQEADARTDVFAFGTVLYEMLTGRKTFQGKTQASLLGAIMQADPLPVSSLQPHASPSLDRVIRKCLAKDPDARWQSTRDLHDELQWIAEARVDPAAPTRETSRSRRPALVRAAWVAAALWIIAATAAAGWLWLGRRPADPAKVSFDINTESAPSPLQIALSPDGARLAAFVNTPQGNPIWLRRLDEVAGQTLAGTTGAAFPFWSPDGRFIGFFAAGKLNKIDIFGGPPQPLCDALNGRGGAWNRDGVILFAPASDGPLFSVPAAGGVPVQVTELDKARGDAAHRHPKFLRDGDAFIFFVASTKPENSGLYLGSLDSKATTRLVPSDSMGLFAPPDHLLFTRSSTLMAQRFDARRLELQGDPFPVAQDVGINTGNSVSGVAVSDTGVLAYRIGGGINERVLRWVDREGKPLGDVGGASSHENATLAPDGERLAETRLDVSTADIWTVDLVRGSSSRFTFDPAVDDNPIWSPDGGRLVFGSTRAGGVRNLYIKSAAGAGQDALLLNTDSSKFPTDWSRDGRHILFTEAKGSQDVWVLPMSGDKKPIPFLQTPFNESRARFSPDGRWIAYTSDEGGVLQIYVQPFPPSGGKWQVSTSGGTEPHWRGDGRELFYNLGGAIWAVEVLATESTSFKAGVPRKLFDAGITGNPFVTRYDVAPDGKRFLLNLNRAVANVVPSIRVVLNWRAGVDSR